VLDGQEGVILSLETRLDLEKTCQCRGIGLERYCLNLGLEDHCPGLGIKDHCLWSRVLRSRQFQNSVRLQS